MYRQQYTDYPCYILRKGVMLKTVAYFVTSATPELMFESLSSLSQLRQFGADQLLTRQNWTSDPEFAHVMGTIFGFLVVPEVCSTKQTSGPHTFPPWPSLMLRSIFTYRCWVFFLIGVSISKGSYKWWDIYQIPICRVTWSRDTVSNGGPSLRATLRCLDCWRVSVGPKNHDSRW